MRLRKLYFQSEKINDLHLNVINKVKNLTHKSHQIYINN